jgi:hypothetical protein
MRYLWFLLIVLFSTPLLAADLLYTLDFETQGDDWVDDFRYGAWNYGGVLHVDTTTAVSAHHGSVSIRGNLWEGRPGDQGPSGYGIDPITGLENLPNPQLEWAPSVISDTADSGQVYVEFAMKLDDGTWGGPDGCCGKSFYITDVNVGVAAFYFSFVYGTGDASFSYNSAWGDWIYDNWGYGKCYLQWPGETYGGPDGNWYVFGVLADYENEIINVYVNGDKLIGTGWRAPIYGYENGDIPMPPDFQMRGLQILYIWDSMLDYATDGDGYAAGYQCDDFKVYDYLPDYEPPPPTPPSGPGVNRDGRTAGVTWTAATLDGGGDPFYYMALARENDLLRAGTIQTRIAALSATLYELNADATTRIYVTASDSAGAVRTTGVETVTEPE